jgi:hypothetical protein
VGPEKKKSDYLSVRPVFLEEETLNMASKDILNSCADMIVVCDDGTIIPCSQYNAVSLCGFIRSVTEHVELETETGTGRKILPFPGVRSSILVITFDILHGLLPPLYMTKQQCLDALEGMNLLESSCMRTFVLDRLLVLATVYVHHMTTTEILDVLPPLLETESHRLSALSIALRAFPLWTHFRVLLRRVHMTHELAQWILTRTMKMFPASVVFCEVLSLIPESVLTLDHVLQLFGMRGFGIHHHPAEVTMSLGFMESIIRMRGWADDTHRVLDVISTVRDSLLVYDAAPMTASTVYGSILIFENTPIVSCMLTIDGRLSVPKRVCISPWLSVTLDVRTGNVQGRLKMGKIDASARHSKSVRVHLTGISWKSTGMSPPNIVVDAWYSFDNVAPGNILTLASSAPSRGNAESVMEGLQSRALNYLRFDVHYGHVDVLGQQQHQ